MFTLKKNLFLILIGLSSIQTASAEECVDSYSTKGCQEVAVKIEHGLEIQQHKVLLAKDTDDDKDGVLNKADNCPNTPAGLEVDQYGCPSAKSLVIHFDTDVYTVADSDLDSISEYALFLKNNPYYDAHVVGNTDSVASDEYNNSLSVLRAQSVKESLISNGVDKNRLTIQGLGESTPKFDNETLKGRSGNRRVDTVLMHNGQQVSPSIYKSRR